MSDYHIQLQCTPVQITRIGHGHGECSYLAHLQKGSITVRPGDTIQRGQVIGRVGNSGISQGPHLHYHLQNGPTLFVDQGLPVQFSHFLMTGDHVEQSAIPARAIVNSLPSPGAV